MRKLVTIVALALMTSCASTDSIDQTIDKVQIAYTGAVTAFNLYCAVNRDKPPCNNAEDMNKIGAAKALLDLAMAKFREDIAAAKTSDAVTLAVKVIMDAIEVYSNFVASFGASPPVRMR